MSSCGLRRARLMFLGVPLLVLVLLLGAFGLFLLRTGSRIRQYESSAQARKEPLTLEELARTCPPIPEDENAAVPLLDLWRSEEPEFWAAYEAGDYPLPKSAPQPPIPFPSTKDASKTKPPVANPDDLAPLAIHVVARSQHREAVRQALQRKSFRFPVRIGDGFAALLPHLSRIKREAQEFQAEGWVAAERGDTRTALRAIKDSAKVGALLRNDPFLIGQLVRIACDSMCLSQVERLLSRQTLAEPQLLELQGVASSLSAMDGFHPRDGGRARCRTGVLPEPAWHRCGRPFD